MWIEMLMLITFLILFFLYVHKIVLKFTSEQIMIGINLLSKFSRHWTLLELLVISKKVIFNDRGETVIANHKYSYYVYLFDSNSKNLFYEIILK